MTVGENVLSFVYISYGFTIYPHRQTIEQEGNIIQVRPKTFALLLSLLEKPREVLSKRYLLDTVWDDVSVDEPVLVQSVRELRQLFGSAEVIQTYPRKGYAWSASVQKQPLQSEVLSPKPAQPQRKLPYALSLVALTLLSLLAVMVYVIANMDKPSSPVTDVVIVLPVKHNIPGNDHHWVPLGAMDQLINSLVSDQHVQVMETGYVLQLMQHADMPRTYASAQVARIFEISGATLIVESQLSGSVADYRIDYKFHARNAVKRGVIFARNTNDLLQKLSDTIATQTNQPLNTSEIHSHTAFKNELMAQALEKLDNGELELARNLLMSLKQLEPENTMVRQTLGNLLSLLGEHDQAITEINAAIKLASPHESARLLFLLATVKNNQGSINDALLTLDQADEQAKRNNDILYLAYIAQLRGSIQQQLSDFDAAKTSFENAVSFHSMIHCPIGISLTHLQLTQLFLLQGQSDLAKAHYAESKRLIDSHHLTHLLPQLESVERAIDHY